MKIEFPAGSAFDFDRLLVVFPVIIDGQRRRILISCEALQDHFGAPTGPTADGQSFVRAFEANRGRIEAMAERLIQMGVAGEILLKSEFF